MNTLCAVWSLRRCPCTSAEMLCVSNPASSPESTPIGALPWIRRLCQRLRRITSYLGARDDLAAPFQEGKRRCACGVYSVPQDTFLRF